MTRTLLKLFAAALAIRWLYAATMFATMGDSGLLGVDSGDYVDRGRIFANEFAANALHGWQWLGPKPIMMPLFTWLLGINSLLSGSYAAFTYVLTQGLLDAGTCVVVFGMAHAIDERFAWPAAVAAAINPTQIVVSGLVYPDTPFVFFVALFLLGALRWRRQPSWSSALLIAIALIGAAWMRILVTPFAPVAVLFLLATSAFERRQVVQLGTALVVFIVSLAPISLRNHALYGSWSLTPQGGMHLARWVVPLVWEARDGTPWSRGYDEMERRAAEKMPVVEENPFRQSQLYTEIALDELKKIGIFPIAKAWAFGAILNLGSPASLLSPPVIQLPRTGFYGTTGSSIPGKIWNFLFRSDNVVYAQILLASIAGLAVFRLMQLAGVIAMVRQGQLAAVLLLVGWCLFVLSINGPVASPKYRLPMEPVLAVFTGAGWSLISRPRKRGHLTA